MKKLILALAVTLIASTASATHVKVVSKGWYVADITVSGEGTVFRKNDLLLGEVWAVDVPGNWSIHVDVNGSRIPFSSTGDKAVLDQTGTESVTLELHGTTLNPSIRIRQ